MVQHWDSETARATAPQREPCLGQQKELALALVSELYSDPPLAPAMVRY